MTEFDLGHIIGKFRRDEEKVKAILSLGGEMLCEELSPSIDTAEKAGEVVIGNINILVTKCNRIGRMINNQGSRYVRNQLVIYEEIRELRQAYKRSKEFDKLVLCGKMDRGAVETFETSWDRLRRMLMDECITTVAKPSMRAIIKYNAKYNDLIIRLNNMHNQLVQMLQPLFREERNINRIKKFVKDNDSEITEFSGKAPKHHSKK